MKSLNTDFNHGMIIAASHVMSAHGQDTIAKEILAMAGITTVENLREARMEDYDIEILSPLFTNGGKWSRWLDGMAGGGGYEYEYRSRSDAGEAGE